MDRPAHHPEVLLLLLLGRTLKCFHLPWLCCLSLCRASEWHQPPPLVFHNAVILRTWQACWWSQRLLEVHSTKVTISGSWYSLEPSMILLKICIYWAKLVRPDLKPSWFCTPFFPNKKFGAGHMATASKSLIPVPHLKLQTEIIGAISWWK